MHLSSLPFWEGMSILALLTSSATPLAESPAEGINHLFNKGTETRVTKLTELRNRSLLGPARGAYWGFYWVPP